jgi:hypothetical protein
MRPRIFLGAHYKIEGQLHIESNVNYFFIPLIDTWGLNMRRDPNKKKDRGWSENCTRYNRQTALVHTTPTPAITRPTTKVAQWVSSCKPMPREKIMHEATIPHLRPTMSPIGNAKSAPKKVLAERMDTCQNKTAKFR